MHPWVVWIWECLTIDSTVCCVVLILFYCYVCRYVCVCACLCVCTISLKYIYHITCYKLDCYC